MFSTWYLGDNFLMGYSSCVQSFKKIQFELILNFSWRGFCQKQQKKLARPVCKTSQTGFHDFLHLRWLLWTCYLWCFDKKSWYLEVIWLSFDFFLSKFMGWKQQNQFLKPAKPVLAEFVQILSFFLHPIAFVSLQTSFLGLYVCCDYEILASTIERGLLVTFGTLPTYYSSAWLEQIESHSPLLWSPFQAFTYIFRACLRLLCLSFLSSTPLTLS